MIGAGSASLVLHSLRNAVIHRKTWRDENLARPGKTDRTSCSGEMPKLPGLPLQGRGRRFESVNAHSILVRPVPNHI